MTNRIGDHLTDWSQVRYLPSPESATFATEEYSVKEMLEMILGTDGKCKLRLLHKTNAELYALYDSQLILKHRSNDALEEARRVLRHFTTYLGRIHLHPS